MIFDGEDMVLIVNESGNPSKKSHPTVPTPIQPKRKLRLSPNRIPRSIEYDLPWSRILLDEETGSDYIEITELVEPASVPRVIADDPDDDYVIAANADLID